MRRLVFGPRRPIVADPPPGAPPGPLLRPGATLVARPTEVFEALLLGGAVLVAEYGGPFLGANQLVFAPRVVREPAPLPPFAGAVAATSAPGYAPGTPAAQTKPAGTLVTASAEPPPFDLLAGRVALSRYGLAQPAVQPTPSTPPPSCTGSREDPPPDPGRAVTAGRARVPLVSSTLPPRPVVARAEPPPPWPGAAAVAEYGFPDARRPVRPTVARTEDLPPGPGAALTGRSPSPPLVRQQPPGEILVARAEDPPPWPGWCLTRAVPRVPSDRYASRPYVARGIDAAPDDGRSLVLRAFWGLLPPAQVRVTVARAEEPPAYPGAVAKGMLPLPNLRFQQQPGRPLVARAEPPQPFAGWVRILLGFVGGGAVPPSPPVITPVPGGRVQRADVWSRRVGRVPRVNGIALAYVTKTKTPSEALSLVFDFSNFPEVVGGAMILSALVTGPGGAPLTGVVAGPPQVLSAPAVVDSLGGTVAAGQGVAVTFFGGGASSDVIVECAATLSVGDAPKCVQVKIAVRNAI